MLMLAVTVWMLNKVYVRLQLQNITLSNTQTVDGVALAAGDRVLVKDQTTASQNGYLRCCKWWFMDSSTGC